VYTDLLHINTEMEI